MKSYNINPVEKTMSWGDPMLVVELGELGRGRTYKIIPYHAPLGEYLLGLGTTRSGNPKIIPSDIDKDWLAVLSGSGCYTRNTYGTCYVPASQKDNVKIVASGKGAFGAAGRIGSYYEYLACIKDDTFIKVRPAGGTHKIERYWLHFTPAKVIELSEEELDIYCDQKDIPNPASENLIDLIDLA